jgi:hypothetical protein
VPDRDHLAPVGGERLHRPELGAGLHQVALPAGPREVRRVDGVVAVGDVRHRDHLEGAAPARHEPADLSLRIRLAERRDPREHVAAVLDGAAAGRYHAILRCHRGGSK